MSSQQTAAIQTVKVTLLLAGGHQYTLSLPSNSPILVAVMKVLASQTGNTANNATSGSQLFQIPLNDDRQALCFPSHQLIGAITEPPLYVQQKAQQMSSPAPQPPAPLPNTITSRFVHLDNFLSDDECDRLLKYVKKRQKDFTSTTTSTGEADYRYSTVLYHFPEFSEMIIERVKGMMPEVLPQLDRPLFVPQDVEAQLTAHNDGHYFKLHNDNGSPDTATRELTYVYYFHNQPKHFSGGELLLYDSTIKNGYYAKADTYQTVEPRHNSIVFFLSRYLHEVLPVRCPSKKFTDSRFTINGWVRRS
ncbi:2OG-Fe(II) oxygenase [Roseofilum sp. BLCC_M154]|uniref:2OG-Fe(II) oxygenase n=1 Tax=Roseofilum acuticapitatum BLCC-M154 TaxID=3022444 RepID=A0ABT7AT71_9CYAN|nr:2OG-Fe(II) oxygenase [Roseofilum acuticapitatum]MDJ1169506.1 2OG-Fe(II) oxygenase [Roseofilum acuticapitatum BLCC-M154]